MQDNVYLEHVHIALPRLLSMFDVNPISPLEGQGPLPLGMERHRFRQWYVSRRRARSWCLLQKICYPSAFANEHDFSNPFADKSNPLHNSKQR